MSSSGSNYVEERHPPAGLAGAAEPPIGVYSESEDDVTRFVETPRPEPKWLVQITPFDRRQMSTEGLLRELRRGQLVHRESLVWRGGTANWRPIAHVAELQAEARAWPASHESGARRPCPPQAQPRRLPSLLAAGAAAFLAGVVTLYALVWAGAFEPGGLKGRPDLANEAR
jgi:hypothetical protein